jgi:alanine racemase
MPVIKANAYGHGAVAVAKIFEMSGARFFGVATLEEALQLRRAGLRSEILVFGPIKPSYLTEAERQNVGVTLWDHDYLKALSGHRLRVHIKVDTGMSRLGFSPELLPGLIWDFVSGRIRKPSLVSAYTHFACADQAGDKVSQGQLERFLKIPWPVRLRLHAANSAAAFRYPKSRLSLVRSGIFLYGALEGQARAVRAQRPVLSFKTQVVRVFDVKKGQGISYGHTFKAKKLMRVATLCAGYADGVPRLLSNRGQVLISGRRCRILGRVCMDLTMVDVSALKHPRLGDEAILIGRQGKEEVTVSEWAGLCHTNTYEILCGISERVPRELAA